MHLSQPAQKILSKKYAISTCGGLATWGARWFWRWPLPTPPFGTGANLAGGHDNSGPYYTMARRHSVVLSPEAILTWETLRTLPKDAWRGIIGSVPVGWLAPQELVDLVNWWWSPQWHTRVSWIRTQL